jgi:hypothetical protein
MNWTEPIVTSVIKDLAEENPLACKALFRIAEVSYTSHVPTLAVSITARPVLYINLEFLNQHVTSEDDLKAVLIHEFLHVMLRHTEKYEFNTPLLNIALDAIINSIIHRLFGTRYSDFFKRLYREKGIEKLLRPAANEEDPLETHETEDEKHSPTYFHWKTIRYYIYEGKYSAEDLFELLNEIHKIGDAHQVQIFTGNHGHITGPLSPENEALLKEIVRWIKADGIWKNPALRGVGSALTIHANKNGQGAVNAWNNDTRRLLKKCLIPDPRQKQQSTDDITLPFISAGDRKAVASMLFNPFIPFSKVTISTKAPAERVNIYLDVSGSMDDELQNLTHLLNHFRQYIRLPLWAFSCSVEKAQIKNGVLKTSTSSGTRISCVLEHIRKNGFKRSLIITDGFTEEITDAMLAGIDRSGLHVLISADGSTEKFDSQQITTFQLKPLDP